MKLHFYHLANELAETEKEALNLVTSTIKKKLVQFESVAYTLSDAATLEPVAGALGATPF